MSENKNIYIDKLLSEIKSFEESVVGIKNNESMPFSFFRESFERTQEISHLLHKLEFMQVDDMKKQMEKLVHFLSESENRGKVQERELEKARENEKKLLIDLENEKTKEKSQELNIESEVVEIDEKNEEQEDIIEIEAVEEKGQSRPVYAEGFVLPEYKNPNATDFDTQEINQKDYETAVPKSINAPLHVIDIKREVSINDRFLFQRELFNNNRNEMNSTLDKLNNFESYEEAEKYIHNSFSWDFDNQVVNDFLLVVKKGFK